jgi:hypothetical protein
MEPTIKTARRKESCIKARAESGTEVSAGRGTKDYVCGRKCHSKGQGKRYLRRKSTQPAVQWHGIFKATRMEMKGNVFYEKLQTTQKTGNARISRRTDYQNIQLSTGHHVSVQGVKTVQLKQPQNLTEEEYANNMEHRMIWKTSIKGYIKRRELLKSNLRAPI